MKIKDLERTVNVAWSPASQYPIYLACGTAAQQLDASFSTNATLELYSLNLSDPGMDMELKSSTSSDNRFYKIVWGSYGIGGDKPSGVIVGGCDGGVIQIYNAAKLLSGEDSAISRPEKHIGPVQALDFNPFQHNLLASGASESEIYIWDLNNTNTPMTPGTKSQPFEPVHCLSWNRQVQHILATAFSSRCVVWDLRKNEPIIKLSDTASHIRWKHVAWHPEVATQLCLASEEDQTPVIQLWDLRFATSPLKILDNHQRGVLSIAWCEQDPDLLISCGKDNRILCWNPNSNLPRGEVLSEVAHTLQWNFDVAWCPRNPAIIAASNFDGHVSVYSLHGGRQTQLQTTNKIADSFPGMDGYVQASTMQQQQAQVVGVDLAKAPKWLKRPVGVSFAFGGRLITFENDKTTAAQIQQAAQAGQVPPLINRSITISQVITEPELIQKSTALEQALQQGNYSEYCRQKADSSQSQHERYIWYFLKANFDPNPKAELLNLLGYQPEDVNNKLKQHIKKPAVTENDVNNLSDHLSSLNRGDDFNATSTFDAIAADAKIAETATKRLSIPFKISTGNDTDGLIAQAILLGNIEVAVELCVEANRMADALIIAMTGGSDLLARTQYRYLQQSKGYVSSLISALVSEDWSTIINQCDVESWKEALAAALTYCSNEELPILCERMGERLEKENNGNSKLLQDAQLCYICAGSFNKLVGSWSSDVSSNNPNKLQELVELVTFMQKAIELQGRPVEVSGNLADLLSHYAILLASQGSLNNALNYLGASSDQQINELRERLYCNLGHKPAYAAAQQQHQSFQARRSSARQSIPGYTQSNAYPQASYPKFNTGLPNAAPAQQPWMGQNPVQNSPSVPPQQFVAPPPKPFSPSPSVPPTQPPRPTSVGSAHGGSKSKYVVDPSVQSNLPSQYGRNMYGAPAPGPVPMQAPQVQPVPLLPTSPAAKTYPAPFAPNSAQPMINHNNFTNPIQNQPVPGSFPMQQFPNTSSTAPMPFQPPQGNIEVAQPAINALPPMSAPPGWNDPPAVSKNARQQQPKPEFQHQAPITHPLFGAAPDPVPMNNGYGDQMPRPYAQMPPPGPMNPPPVQQQPMNHFNPQAMFAQQSMQPPMQQQAPPPQQQAPPPEPVKKGPIPEEHMYLQTVFDELRTQCTCAASNPQTKRKLEDVTRKLESLYDMLREHKLSPNTLTGLHQMVQLVQNGDYTGGLSLHTQLVSGPDFAQIASFMPGLKVLLQCALQLQVYLR